MPRKSKRESLHRTQGGPVGGGVGLEPLSGWSPEHSTQRRLVLIGLARNEPNMSTVGRVECLRSKSRQRTIEEESQPALPWETEESEEFDVWFDSLNQADQEQVLSAQGYLEDAGPTARMPMSYPIKQPNRCGMKELRPGSRGRSEIRIMYAFDFRRKALLLLGGDKAAIPGDWDAWYDRNVPVADAIFTRLVDVARRTDQEQARRAPTEVGKGQPQKTKKPKGRGKR